MRLVKYAITATSVLSCMMAPQALGTYRAVSYSKSPAQTAQCATLPLCHEGLDVYQLSSSFANDNQSAHNFTALTMDETTKPLARGLGSVGTTQYIVASDSFIKSFNKSTCQPDNALSCSVNAFFAPRLSGQHARELCLKYDAFAHRWIIAALSNDHLLLAISDTETLTHTTNWAYYSYAHQDDRLAQGLTLGVDKHALYLGANLLKNDNNQSAFSAGAYYIIPKSPLLARGSLQVAYFEDPRAYGPQGVDNFDHDTLQGYFVSIHAGLNDQLVIQAINHPDNTPRLGDVTLIQTLPFAQPINIPHKATPEPPHRLVGLDASLCPSHIRNRRLLTAHTIAINHRGIVTPDSALTRNGCRWYEIDLEKKSIKQAGLLHVPSLTDHLMQRHYFAPGIMTNGTHTLAIACSSAGYQKYIDAAFTQRFYSDAAGSLRVPIRYTSSTESYTTQSIAPWPPFSSVSIDPADDMTMWALAGFCDKTGSFALRALKVAAQPPPMPNLAVPSVIKRRGRGIVEMRIYANKLAGEFYHQLTGKSSHKLKVSIGGAIEVLDAKYASPHSLTVRITTRRARKGSYRITITNPDGQSVTSNPLITII